MSEQQRGKRPSHHIVHDYVNLISAGTYMGRDPKPPFNCHLQYSFILQYRKFADFFANRRKRVGRRPEDRDMLAKDFVSRKVRYDLPEWRKWEDHMNVHLFHLSQLRVRNSRPWTGYTENPRMFEQFKIAWKRFFDALPPPLQEEFREEIEEKRIQVASFDLELYPPSRLPNA